MTEIDLKAWRERQNLSQAALADLLSIDVMTVSRWERGERQPPAFLHLALRALEREASGTSASPLLDGRGNETGRYRQTQERLKTRGLL